MSSQSLSTIAELSGALAAASGVVGHSEGVTDGAKGTLSDLLMIDPDILAGFDKFDGLRLGMDECVRTGSQKDFPRKCGDRAAYPDKFPD